MTDAELASSVNSRVRLATRARPWWLLSWYTPSIRPLITMGTTIMKISRKKTWPMGNIR